MLDLLSGSRMIPSSSKLFFDSFYLTGLKFIFNFYCVLLAILEPQLCI